MFTWQRPRHTVWDGKWWIVTYCWYLWEGRQQYFAEDDAQAWCCSTEEHSNKRSEATKPCLKIAHYRLFCSLCTVCAQLYNHKKFSCDPGQIITVLTEITDPMGHREKKMYEMYAAPYLILSKTILAYLNGPHWRFDWFLVEPYISNLHLFWSVGTSETHQHGTVMNRWLQWSVPSA